MPFQEIPAPASVTLTSLRRSRGLTEQDLSVRAGLSARMISVYEKKRAPSIEKLEWFGALMGYEADEVHDVLRSLERAVRAPEEPLSPMDPPPAVLARIRRYASKVGRAAEELAELHAIQEYRARRARKDRRRAARLWAKFKALPSKRQRLLVERSRQFQTWAFAERLCHESEEAASDSARTALRLAGLAHRVARMAPGNAAWRSRLEAYALAYISNALRVQTWMRRAGRAFTRARQRWEEGAGADPGVLEAWRFYDREASVHRDQRLFLESLKCLDQALSVAPQGAKGRILLNKAFTLEQMDEPEQAIETLREAEPLIESRRDRNLRFSLCFNFSVNLCHLYKYEDAQSLLDEVRELAIELRKELHLVRVTWLSAKVDAGLGREEQAQENFEQVRREFKKRNMSYDYALASLELSELWLAQGRSAEVRSLADDIVWIFESEDIHREAEAALHLFQRAAIQEQATVALTRRLVLYLYRARYNPQLRFEA